MKPEWQWDEFHQIGTDYESADEVAAYDRRMRQFRDIDREVDEFLRLTDLGPGGRLLEIGTGTGALARRAAARGCHVTALDISQPMLEYASSKASEEKLENIEFVRAGFLSYEGAPNSFDAVITGMAMHHLPDLWKMAALVRINKWLKPDGNFCLHDVVFCPSPDDFDGYFERATAWNLGGSKSNFIGHIRQEYSTLDWIMTGLLERAGFRIMEVMSGEPDWVNVYHCRIHRKL